jgi:Bacterial TSP3 repeat
MRRVQLFAYAFLVVGLTACGGGGSSSDSGSSVSTNTFPPQTPLVYSGVTTGAAVTATSAGPVASNVIGASTTGGSSSLLGGVSAQASAAPAQPTGATGFMRRLAQALRTDSLVSATASGAKAGAAVDQTTNCDSGTIHVSGTLADNGTGTISVAYNACRTGLDTINGPASIKVNAYDATNKIITDGVITFTRVNFTGPGINSDFTGTLATQVDVNNATETLTQNIVTQDNTRSGHMTQTQNLVISNHFDDAKSPSFFTQSISGRVFDSTLGFVDVTTTTAPFTAPWGPLYFATQAQSFPDWGIIDLTGATGHVRITSFGVDLAKLEVDATGAGTFQNTARMRWAEFNTAIGADLADNDGDGMHNSWETFYGLNPNDPSDANVDSDGDGFSNKAEYLAGSNPRSSGSIPAPVRHIWVTNVRDLAADAASGMIDIFVGATGSGVQLDPVTTELGATFSGVTEPNGSTNRTTTDAQGRTFTIAPTTTATTWTITSSTGASFTITDVAGTDAGSLIRYGAHGLAFRTVGASSPGYVYLVESTALVP